VALSNVDRLESLVTDFILLTNIDHGNLNRIRQHIDVENHILFPIRKRMERYRSKNIRLVPRVSIQGEITAPRREFIQSLVHLVDNAVKFGPENGTVELMIESAEDGSTAFTVQDEGEGIPHDLRDKVFERYYQIDQGDSRKYEGLGVGLTIARAVFANMGGTVSVLDSDQGCRVQAILPARTTEDILYG
jgi:signal transduction histidine kinase